METRPLGSTGLPVTPVGLGTWNMSSGWGEYSDEDCRGAVRAALDAGIDFVDTADVYRGGEAEARVGDVLAERDDDPVVATKAGRRVDGSGTRGYDYESLAGFAADSAEKLGVDTLDLLQLHCPPTEIFYTPEVFDALADLRADGYLDHYGVSVELVEQARKAIEYPGVETVQIIFNPFRQRPAEQFFEEAACRDVGVIVRVPLASGLLAGAFDADTEFPEGDHRAGEGGAGSRGGETFAGVPFEAGVAAADDLREHVPDEMTMAQFTLRWILDHDAVTTVIPGSMTPEHVRENAAAAALDSLSHQTHGAVRDVYEEHLYDQVHHRW
jgi:aryl-alcohol dehydrogenase-like predicted oxidoreductase